MTLQEVVKSGKRFKRSNDSFWLKLNAKESPFLILKEADIFATDWEVENKVVTINEAQLKHAVEALACFGSVREIVCNELAIELGLKKRETPYSVGKI